MSYYQFNRQEIMQKAKEMYSKEKAAEYYLENKEATKKKSKDEYKNLPKKEKDKIKEYQRKRYQQLVQYKKRALQNKWVLVLLSIRMSEKTLKFDNIRLDKKEFHKSKQPINLDLVNADQIVAYDKFNHNDDGFKYFTGYKEGEVVKPLCIILPEMSGYIKYFENDGKNISFMVKNDVLGKYNKICNKIKKTLSIKFHSMLFRWWNTKRKCALRSHSLLTTDSVMRMEKKEWSTSLFRRMQMQNKEYITMSKFINTDLESESESKSDTELELKSRLKSYSK